MQPGDNTFGYSDDIKFTPGPRFPPPQPDEPQLQVASYVEPYQHKSPRVPKSPKKTPIAQTVPLSTLQLPGMHIIYVPYRTLNAKPWVNSPRAPIPYPVSHLRLPEC